MFSRRLDPIPSWACLLQVFALDAVTTPSRRLSLVALVVTLSSHCHRQPSAIRHRAWLASLEAAYLLEVFDLLARPSCPDRSSEIHHSASVDHLAMTGFRLFVPAVQFDRQPFRYSVFSFAFRRTQRRLSRGCTNSRKRRVESAIVWFQLVVPVQNPVRMFVTCCESGQGLLKSGGQLGALRKPIQRLQ